jgi:hypothetical protein
MALPKRTANQLPATRKLTEADIEKQCSDLLALDGWRSLKTDPVSRREWGKGFGELGMADRLYLRYEPELNLPPPHRKPVDNAYAQVLWIEWKRPGRKLRYDQEAWAITERSRGALVLAAGVDFPATFEGFTAWYRGSGLMRRAGLC